MRVRELLAPPNGLVQVHPDVVVDADVRVDHGVAQVLFDLGQQRLALVVAGSFGLGLGGLGVSRRQLDHPSSGRSGPR